MVHEVWGQKEPPQWSGQKSSSNFGTEFPHNRPPRPNQDLFSSQNKTGGLSLWYQIVLGFEKYIWWRLIFHLFGTPFADFSKGNGGEIGQNGVSGQVLLRFAPFLLQEYFYWNVDDSYKNDTNQVIGWWDMREWWWKIGFTPRAIKHVCPSWQHSSSGANSYLWILSLIVASLGAHAQFTFQKHPFFRPLSTPSGIFGEFHAKITVYTRIHI
jgi:hypothetical protein